MRCFAIFDCSAIADFLPAIATSVFQSPIGKMLKSKYAYGS